MLRQLVGLESLSEMALLAADVTRDGRVTAMDAALILDVVSGCATLPFPNATSWWLFTPERRSYTALSADQPNQDFTAIMLGDVSGNALAAASPVQQTLAAEVPPYFTVQVSSPDRNGWVEARVIAHPQGRPFLSVAMTLHYDPARTAELALTPGDLTSPGAFRLNTAQNGRIRLALARTQPVTEPGELLILRYRQVNTAPAFTLSSIMFDEQRDSGLPTDTYLL